VAFYGYSTKIALVTLPRVCLIGLKSQMNSIFLPSSVTLRAFEKIPGGNKIKQFGDGEENQKFEKKKKENF